ncbi:MAG: ATP synthase F1 subunit delta [Candidatus Omnitrophota bacterium]|nr:ATP synthase F1 subunit delta [Candidatus Omnitrophota bacterium]
MKEKIIAKRYAEAFLDYARHTIGLKKATEELSDLRAVFSQNPDLLEFLDNLNILYKEKCDCLDAALKDFSDETRVFVKLILEFGRIKNIIAVTDYVRINYSRGEAIDALLKTSYPLDLELVQAVKEKMEHKFKRKLSLHIELDGNLLGGVQVTVGNTVVDGSVRRRLEELKEKLTASRVN